jgi:hypothetical protein
VVYTGKGELMAYVVLQQINEFNDGGVLERLDDVSTEWTPNGGTPGNRADLFDQDDNGLAGWRRFEGEWIKDGPYGTWTWTNVGEA